MLSMIRVPVVTDTLDKAGVCCIARTRDMDFESCVELQYYRNNSYY